LRDGTQRIKPKKKSFSLDDGWEGRGGESWNEGRVVRSRFGQRGCAGKEGATEIARGWRKVAIWLKAVKVPIKQKRAPVVRQALR